MRDMDCFVDEVKDGGTVVSLGVLFMEAGVTEGLDKLLNRPIEQRIGRGAKVGEIHWCDLEGETVLDNTMGSGTTGVACVNTDRNFVGIELDATYFAIAEKRIADAQEWRRNESQQRQLPLAA